MNRAGLGRTESYGYSSPHLVTIDGVRQIVLLSGPGAIGMAVDGTKLWEFAMPAGARITQPAQIGDGDLLVNEGESHNLHRIGVSHGVVEERWSSNGLKPYFSDFVVHGGYAYGFDGLLSSIDLKDGKRVWKGGRYGSGQLLLIADQDLLLVLSEEGELALVGGDAGVSSRIWRGSRRLRGRRGIIRCWWGTCCWFATGRRWRRSG